MSFGLNKPFMLLTGELRCRDALIYEWQLLWALNPHECTGVAKTPRNTVFARLKSKKTNTQKNDSKTQKRNTPFRTASRFF